MGDVEFGTRKDGTVYPIRRRGRTTVVAAALAVGMAATGGTLGVSGSIGSAGSVAGEVALNGRLVAKVKSGRTHAAKGRHRQAWRELDLRQVGKRARQAVNCAVLSYGDVREFFLRKPCRAVDRLQLGLQGGNGQGVAVAIAWVEMPSSGTARELRRLVDTHGTGNVIAKTAAALGEPNVRYAGQHYHSDLRGRTVAIAEAEKLDGAVSDGELEAVARIAAAFPAP